MTVSALFVDGPMYGQERVLQDLAIKQDWYWKWFASGDMYRYTVVGVTQHRTCVIYEYMGLVDYEPLPSKHTTFKLLVNACDHNKNPAWKVPDELQGLVSGVPWEIYPAEVKKTHAPPAVGTIKKAVRRLDKQVLKPMDEDPPALRVIDGG